MNDRNLIPMLPGTPMPPRRQDLQLSFRLQARAFRQILKAWNSAAKKADESLPNTQSLITTNRGF